MGVRGLTTYVNYNSKCFMHDFQLHNTNLVIDGHSLCAQIYRFSNCYSAFGGDYDRIASYVKAFFKSLKKCNITSYVIFDGSLEKRKLKTAYSRLRSKIYGASRLDPVTQGSIQIFPLLLRDVFREVLSEMNIMYTICEFEADDEIAALARFLNCPVLSYDSDFFIYNVQYIPFNTLDKKPKLAEEEESKYYFLECKIYKVEFLTEHFGGLNKELLPLLATLLGNDYVEKKVFRKFFSQMKIPKGKKTKNEQQRCIHGLFLWLQNETLESAITKIIGRLKKAEKGKVLRLINKSIYGYNKRECKSLQCFNLCYEETSDDNVNIKGIEEIETEAAESEGISSSDSETDHSCSLDEKSVTEDEENFLPTWFSDRIRMNQIPRCFINLYTHSLYFCGPQAEDYTKDDAHLCSLRILRYAFDMLTDFSQEVFIYVSRDRDCNYKRMYINQEMSSSRALETPLSELTTEQLHTYFYNFFKENLPKLDFCIIDMFPASFKLYAIAIIWWITNCDVTIGHVHSLLLCYTYLEAVDEKLGNVRGHSQFNNKFSQKLQDLKKRSLQSEEVEIQMLNKNKVQYEDCLLAASVLLKHFDLDDTIKKKPKSYDTCRIHVFAQFQCCLHMINSLNVLCGCPFQSTTYSKSYNGTFIYNIAMKLENEMEPMLFVKKYLNGAMSVLGFYDSLFSILNKLVSEMDLKFHILKHNKKRSRRRKKNQVDDEISFLIKGFEADVKI